MEGGATLSAGMRRSRDASTSTRSSSKKRGSFIVTGGASSSWKWLRSRFALAFGVEGLSGEFAVSFFEKDFYAALGLLELLLAFARERHALFEEFHGIVERQLRAFE